MVEQEDMVVIYLLPCFITRPVRLNSKKSKKRSEASNASSNVDIINKSVAASRVSLSGVHEAFVLHVLVCHIHSACGGAGEIETF